MSIARRLAHGVFWSLIGTVAARVCTLGAAVITARLLGKEGYGELGMIQSTIVLLGTFAGFGLGVTTTKHVAELKEKDPLRAGRIIAMTNMAAVGSGLLMVLVCLLAAPWLAQKTLNAPQLAPELRLGAALLLVSTLLGVQTGTLSGLQNFKAIAHINLYQGIISLPLAFVLVYFWGLMGAVLSLVIPVLIGVAQSSRILSRECAAAGIRVSFRGAWSESRVLRDFSLPAFLASVMAMPATWAANAILVNQQNGYAEMGLLNAANQFRLALIFIPFVLGTVTVPLLSEIHGKGDQELFARAICFNLRTVWSLVLGFGFILIGLSYWLMDIFGRQFVEGRTVLAFMVCATILNLASNTVGQALISSGKMWVGFYVNLAWTLVLLPVAAWLAPSMGALGVALAFVLAYALHIILLLLYTAANYGRQVVRGTPLLFLFTGVVFLLSLGIERFPQALIAGLGITFAMASSFLAWRLLPLERRQQIIGLAWVSKS